MKQARTSRRYSAWLVHDNLHTSQMNQIPATNNILVIDDHPMLCKALGMAVGELFPLHAIHTAHSVKEGLDAFLQRGGTLQWSLILCDLNLPDGNGLDLVKQMKLAGNIPVLILTGQGDPITVQSSRVSGADGFFQKTSDQAALAVACHDVMNGKKHFPGTSSLSQVNAVAPSELTDRQKQVLDLLLAGKPNKVIAEHLKLQEGTVKNLVSTLFDVFDIDTRSRSTLISTVTKLGYKSP